MLSLKGTPCAMKDEGPTGDHTMVIMSHVLVDDGSRSRNAGKEEEGGDEVG